MNYDQARKDHEYLWETYNPAEDMTGAYVDQDDLKKLLEKPTKKTATGCYISQIRYWLSNGPDRFNCDPAWQSDPEVFEIAERHCMEDEFQTLIEN